MGRSLFIPNSTISMIDVLDRHTWMLLRWAAVMGGEQQSIYGIPTEFLAAATRGNTHRSSPNQLLQPHSRAQTDAHTSPLVPRTLSAHLRPRSSEAAHVSHSGRPSQAAPLDHDGDANTTVLRNQRPPYSTAHINRASSDLLGALSTSQSAAHQIRPHCVTVSQAGRR